MNDKYSAYWDQIFALLPPEDLRSDSIDVGEPYTLHRRGDRFNSCTAHHTV